MIDLPRSARSIFIATTVVLSLLSLAIGWAVFTANTIMMQVLAAIALAGALWTDWQERKRAQFGLLFLAGACIGALAYHGTVSILLTLVWLALLVWVGAGIVHHEVRDHASQ
jgi:hypothetical protein